MKRAKKTPLDWVLTQWARACDEAKIVDASRVESTVEVEKDDSGRLVDPSDYLIRRAEKTLASIGLFGKRWTDRAARVWFVSGLLAIALGAIVFPVARAERILDGEVNLAGPFVFFILGQIFFLTLTLILLATVALQSFKRFIFREKRPRTFAEKLVEGLSGLVGSIVLFGLREVAPVFYAMFGRKGTERFGWKRKKVAADASSESESPEERKNRKSSKKSRVKKLDPTRKGAALFWDVLFSRPRFLFFWGGCLSHLFWASCSVCVLIALGARMQGNQYDYCWRTSLEDETAVKKAVDFLGRPIELLGFSTPSAEDVAKLFDAKGVAAVTEGDAERTEEQKTAAETRARWSYFLLWIVLIWCVLPRLALVFVYNFALRISLRDYRPDLKDPYFKAIIERAESYATTTASSVVNDPAEESVIPDVPLAPSPAPEASAEPSKPSERALSASEPNGALDSSASDSNTAVASDSPALVASDASTDEEPEPEPVEPEPAEPPAPPRETNEILAFGYDADLPLERWRAILPEVPEPTIFGDVAGDIPLKKRFKEYLAENGAYVALCVFVTDVGLSPARHYVKFMKESVAASIPNARVCAIMSGGEKLRLKFGPQTRAIGERLEDWTNALGDLARVSGLTVSPAFFYDADLDLPEPRERLRQLIRTGIDPGGQDSKRTRDYGKWDSAVRRTLAECRSIFGDDQFRPDEESDRRRIAEVCSEIFETYQKETEIATESGVKEIASRLGGGSLLAKIDDAASAARSAISSAVAREGLAVRDALSERREALGLSPDFIERRLTSAWGLSEKARRFCSKLSPKCALATATVGLSIPALVAFAPLLGGAATATAVASTFGALGTLLPSSLASGAAAGAIGAVAPMSLTACKKKLTAKLGSLFGKSESGDSATDASSEGAAAEAGSDLEVAKIESVASLVFVAATWSVVLELQGRAEDEIATLAPRILDPLESATFESISAVESALGSVRALLPVD